MREAVNGDEFIQALLKAMTDTIEDSGYPDRTGCVFWVQPPGEVEIRDDTVSMDFTVKYKPRQEYYDLLWAMREAQEHD